MADFVCLFLQNKKIKEKNSENTKSFGKEFFRMLDWLIVEYLKALHQHKSVFRYMLSGLLCIGWSNVCLGEYILILYKENRFNKESLKCASPWQLQRQKSVSGPRSPEKTSNQDTSITWTSWKTAYSKNNTSLLMKEQTKIHTHTHLCINLGDSRHLWV